MSMVRFMWGELKAVLRRELWHRFFDYKKIVYIAFFQVIDYNGNMMSGAVPEGGPLVPYHRASGPLLFYMRKYFLGG